MEPAGVEYFGRSNQRSPVSVVLASELLDPGTGLYPAQNAGLLGARFDPFHARSDPADQNYRVDDSLRMPVGLSIERLASRRDLLSALDQERSLLEASFKTRNYDQYRQEAFGMVTDGRLARALAVDDEPATVRDRYGRNTFGQSMLLARRLIEAGVPIVQANISPPTNIIWDTHYNNFSALRNQLLPPFDRTISALIDDMQSRELLKETLVVAMGEFGRTPRLVSPNGSILGFTSAGRDHWMSCFFGLFAGAGVEGGQVIGRSDAIGAFPLTPAYRHSDVAATVYTALGIDPRSEFFDIQGRSHHLNNGNVIEALYTGRGDE
ncbi:MAG: DUF1501 domain-containing protein [Planctomycetaceae bacterium]